MALPITQGVAQSTRMNGTPHDLSDKTVHTWNTRSGVCSPCHTAHNTNPDKLVPLWAHATTNKTFVPYDSPTMQAVDKGQQPSGVSKACLSCHDGSLAINQAYSGLTGNTTEFVDPDAQIANDGHLDTTHPISFTYSDALASTDGGLYPPTTTYVVNGVGEPTIGLANKTISQALLVGGKMECSSCHDVHAAVGSASKRTGAGPTYGGIFLKISGVDATGRGSVICRNCHDK